ncbi:MAG: HEAT repeat domain-containing protein [Armatimonadota bacterium]
MKIDKIAPYLSQSSGKDFDLEVFNPSSSETRLKDGREILYNIVDVEGIYAAGKFKEKVNELLNELNDLDTEKALNAASELRELFSYDINLNDENFKTVKEAMILIVNGFLLNKNKDDKLRARLVLVLGKIAHLITKKLDDQNPLVREKTIKMFNSIIWVFSCILKDDEELSMVKSNTTKALDYMCLSSIPKLIDTMSDENEQVKINAKVVVSNIITALVKIIKSKQRTESMQENVVSVLSRIGIAAVPELSQLLSSRDKETCITAARVIRNIGWKAQGAIPELINALENRDEEIREAVIDALVNIGQATAVAVIERLDKDETCYPRNLLIAKGMIDVLRKIGKKDYAQNIKGEASRAVANFLWHCMKNQTKDGTLMGQYRELMRLSAELLGGWESSAGSAYNTLENIFKVDKKDKEGNKNLNINAELVNFTPVLDAAACAMVKINQHEAVKYFLNNKDTEKLIKEDSKKLHAVVFAFGEVKSPPLEVVNYLIKALDAQEYFTRKTAVQSLGKLGSSAKTALPALKELYDGRYKNHDDMKDTIKIAIGSIKNNR